MNDHVLLTLLWIVYCVLHSVLADTKVKEQLSASLGRSFRFYRLFYTLFALLGFIAIILFQLQMDSPWLFARTVWTQVAGGIITTAGLIIMLICIRKYFTSLSGIRSLYEKIPVNHLQITGIHRHVRHPLYLGTFIFIWGLLLLFPVLSLLLSNLVITIYTLIGITFEEKKLELEFGDSYRQYKRKVPKIIPGYRRHL